jgi:hypothetical protein
MSFLTDTDVNKRAGNLFVALPLPTPPAASGLVFRGNTADFAFLAQYTASTMGFLGIPPSSIGGVLDPAFAGTNVALSSSNTVAILTGEGSVVSTQRIPFTNTAAPMFEVFVNGVQPHSFMIGTYASTTTSPVAPDGYNAEAAFGSRPPGPFFCTYYLSGGAIQSNFASNPAPAIAVGDCVGVLFFASNIFFYLNGVFVGQGSNSNVYAPCLSALP